MSTTHPGFNHSPTNRSFFKNMVANWVKAYVPRRIKRMIFLASVASMIAKNQDDRAIASKLNAVLHIAYKDDATILPMYIKNWIWKDLLKDPYINIHAGKVSVFSLPDQQMDAADYETVGAFFRTLAPDWLVYGSEALVAHDLRAVFNQVLAKA